MQLDAKEAYISMFEFLASLYEVNKSDELGALLGSMGLLEDEITVDPAMWNSWLTCVEKVKSGEADAFLHLQK